MKNHCVGGRTFSNFSSLHTPSCTHRAYKTLAISEYVKESSVWPRSWRHLVVFSWHIKVMEIGYGYILRRKFLPGIYYVSLINLLQYSERKGTGDEKEDGGSGIFNMLYASYVIDAFIFLQGFMRKIVINRWFSHLYNSGRNGLRSSRVLRKEAIEAVRHSEFHSVTREISGKRISDAVAFPLLSVHPLDDFPLYHSLSFYIFLWVHRTASNSTPSRVHPSLCSFGSSKIYAFCVFFLLAPTPLHYISFIRPAELIAFRSLVLLARSLGAYISSE